VNNRPAERRAKRLQEARERLKAHLQRQGLRSTRQRQVVLEAFVQEDSHVSVEELYDQVHSSNPDIGHATVYRCMSLFVEAGIAKEGRFHEGRARYEAGFDANHHDHLICVACGHIEEFEDPTIERIQEEIAGARGFTVRYHRLELYGLCPRCVQVESTNSLGSKEA
jgi:Fur family transcriptional regulator, ferric uptake regulator